jgi:hypothetical protein
MAVLEVDVRHTRYDMSAVKADIRDMSRELEAMRADVEASNNAPFELRRSVDQLRASIERIQSDSILDAHIIYLCVVPVACIGIFAMLY